MIRRWLGRLFPSATEKVDQEEDKILSALSRGYCPDCKSTEFYHGPQGGAATNIKCAGCGSKFNVAVVGGPIFFAERI